MSITCVLKNLQPLEIRPALLLRRGGHSGHAGLKLAREMRHDAYEALDHHQLLVDIGLAKTELRRVLDTVDYSNLDENPDLRGVNTTTEYMAFHVHRLLAAACVDGRLGHGGRAVTWLKILLREAPTAWAAFEGPLTPEGQ